MKDKIYYKDGTIFKGEWFKIPHYEDASKVLHREGGPAIECTNGTKEWYLNSQRHREDGPAQEWAGGFRYWYLNGKELKALSKKYLIRYMELTGETLTTLLLHPDRIVRDSVKKYKWS